MALTIEVAGVNFLIKYSGLSICCLLLWAFAAGAKTLPALSMDGEPQLNACKPKEVIRLKGQVADAHGEAAWPIVFAALCSESSMTPRFVRQHSTNKVLRIVEGLDGPAIPLMAKQRAWNAVAIRDFHGFSVNYWVNEACVRSIKFERIDSAWRISDLSETCD